MISNALSAVLLERYILREALEAKIMEGGSANKASSEGCVTLRYDWLEVDREFCKPRAETLHSHGGKEVFVPEIFLVFGLPPIIPISACVHTLAQISALRKRKVSPQPIPHNVFVEGSSHAPPRHTPAPSAALLFLDLCHSSHASRLSSYVAFGQLPCLFPLLIQRSMVASLVSFLVDAKLQAYKRQDEGYDELYRPIIGKS